MFRVIFRVMARGGQGVLLVAVLCCLTTASGRGEPLLDRLALWHLVANQCVPDERALGVPFPCEAVDLQKGYAVVRIAPRHLLLVPTVPIAGIESPELIAPTDPNYLNFAWDARQLLDKTATLPLPRDRIGLAINSQPGRSQDQLHVHLGCVKPEARAALNSYEANPVGLWTRMTVKLHGYRYRVMRIEGDGLTDQNPLRLLAADLAGSQGKMAGQTLVVVGATFTNGRNGFYLLNDSALGNDLAIGEHLLDYRCSKSSSVSKKHPRELER